MKPQPATKRSRTGHERVRAINAKRPPLVPPVAILPGLAPMTARLADLLRAMVDRQRERERGSTP